MKSNFSCCILDASGNTVGNGIHDITAVLDGNTANVYVLMIFMYQEIIEKYN